MLCPLGVFILNNSGHSHQAHMYLMKYDVGLQKDKRSERIWGAHN